MRTLRREMYAAKRMRISLLTTFGAEQRSDPFQRTNDDNVLLCCLYFRDLGYRVMLLSDDNNLCCKALVHNVATLSKDELPDPDHADALLKEMLHLPEPQQAQSPSSPRRNHA